MTALSVGERAEERIEALIDLNDQDGLWDVASMVDYADLLDQLPMPETDEEDRQAGGYAAAVPSGHSESGIEVCGES